jgi:heme O synthase-like polyprenyltransferase
MTVGIAVIIAIMVLAMLVIFPVLGLGMIPIVVLAVVVGAAWLLLAARRGAGAPRSGRARYVST